MLNWKCLRELVFPEYVVNTVHFGAVCWHTCLSALDQLLNNARPQKYTDTKTDDKKNKNEVEKCWSKNECGLGLIIIIIIIIIIIMKLSCLFIIAACS